MKIIRTKASFSTDFAIVDNESTGVFSCKKGILDADTFLVGIFVDDTITQLMLKDGSKREEFRKAVSDEITALDGKPLFAFNADMEMGSFKKILGTPPRIREIKPFNGRGVTKEFLFSVLVRERIVQGEGFEDPLNGESCRCPECWKNGNHEDVRKHNVSCLTKEAKILLHSGFLRNYFSKYLRSDGWLGDDFVLQRI